MNTIRLLHKHARILQKIDSQLRAWQTTITDPPLPLQGLYDRLKSSARRVFD